MIKKINESVISLDSNESYWSLACILGFMGIPNMILGNSLAKTYGIIPATVSIIVGNFILWILGLAIFRMSEGKNHAIDNVKKQLGKTSSFLAIFLFILAFLMWYTLQLSSTTSKICEVFQFHEKWQVGLILGSIIATLSSGGFKTIKWICVIGIPILIGAIIYNILGNHDSSSYVGPYNFSLFGVLPVTMTWLAGTANLPTFFRHSRSKADVTIALALILIFHTFFQVSTIFYRIDIFSMSLSDAKQNQMLLTLVISTAFSLISFISMNLINVYFISACWEMVFPKSSGCQKYVISALIGTFTYLYLEVTNQLQIVSVAENAITYSMAILVLALVTNFLISAIKHRSHRLDHLLGSLSWIIGCVVIIVQLIRNPEQTTEAFTSGVMATILFSLLTVFIEETIRSSRLVLAKDKH